MEKQGFVGIYYHGIYRTDRAIIASGGASCDEKLSVPVAAIVGGIYFLIGKIF